MSNCNEEWVCYNTFSKVEKRWHSTKKVIILLAALLVLACILIPVLRCHHVWMEATCQAPQTCENCGKTRGEPVAHSCTEATCVHPPICRYCIEAQGEPLEHDWQDATCMEPQTCKRCHATQGKTAAHTLGDSTDGITKSCSVCGESVEIQYVSLTFDDGPTGKITQTLLEGLKERNAEATFFLCGYRIKLFPDFPALIDQAGCEVALHTENHSYLTKLSASQIRKEIQNELNRIPGDIPVHLLRPPGGLINDTVESVCRDFGLGIVMWSLDTEDWDKEDTASIVDSIKQASDGDIILMHELEEKSITAALEAIDIMQAKGYEFVTVSELARIKGKSLYGGSVYYSL